MGQATASAVPTLSAVGPSRWNGTSRRHSSVSSPHASPWTALRFGACTLLLSLVFSLLAKPWVALSWWMVFRRCVSIAAAISLWCSITQWERRSISSYGLASLGAGKRQLLCGMLLGFLTLGLLLGIGLLSGAWRVEITDDRLRLWRTALSFFPAALLVSALEELVFRGILLQSLLRSSRLLAIAASSALYAVVHLKTAAFGIGTWLQLGGLFLLGSVLALGYLATRQLYLSLGLHATLAYGARINKLLIAFPQESSGWLVGTGRMVDGLVSWIILLGVGVCIVWWARRTRMTADSRHTG